MINIEIKHIHRFWPKVDKTKDGCWEWTAGKNSAGYGVFHAHKAQLAHRVSWVIEHGNTIGDLLVLHKCDNPPCVNPAHLFLGTHSDNMKDAYEKGRLIDSLTTLDPNDQGAVGTVCAVCWSPKVVKRSDFERCENHFCSPNCMSIHKSIINWPKIEIVFKMVVDSSYAAVGRNLGVTDNAIRHRFKHHLGWVPSYQELRKIRQYREQVSG